MPKAPLCFNLNKIERTNYRAGKMWKYFLYPGGFSDGPNGTAVSI